MGHKLTMDLRLGSGGGWASFTNPAIPAVENIVRCWSLRRNVPAYKKGAGIRELRASGGSENDVLFLNSGLLSITGADAFANVIYDQKGNADSKLVQGTFSSSPKVFESNAMLKGLYFSNGKILQMGVPDATLEAALADIATGFTVSFWLRASSVTDTTDIIIRRSASIGYLEFRIYASAIYVRLRESIFRPSGAITANTWINVCMTVKKSGAYDKRLVYVNASNPTERVVADAASVAAGALTFQSNAANVELNDFIVWNKELTSTEVLSMYNAQAEYYGAPEK